MAIAIRGDLQLSCGKAVAQGAHAAVVAVLETKKKRPSYFKKWYNEGQRKIVVKVRDLEHLLSLKKNAIKLGLVAVVVRDAGLTEIPPDTITCCAIGPGPEKVVDKVTGSLPLYR